jgi:hypothetical protein
VIEVHQRGEHTTAQIAELFSVGRSTVYRQSSASVTLPPKCSLCRRVRGERALCAGES